MRKFFTLLTMCLLASAAWAVDIEFVAGVDNGTSDGTAHAFYIEKEGIRIDITNGLANNTQYRIYKGQTMTVASSIGAITEIKIECTAENDAQYGPGCFTVVPEGYTYSGKIGTWTGSATPVVFTASSNQVRATKITVTVGQAGLAAPSITPAAGTYYDPIQVQMTCVTPNAKIYYTTNGSKPTTSSTQYTAPFTLSTNTTVKAIAALDGEESGVTEAVYEFATAIPVANIGEYIAAAEGTVVKFTNPVNVLAQYNSNLYVKDGSGYALFYGKPGPTYKNGDVIPAGFVGTRTVYNGEPELKDLVNFQAASGNNPILPEDNFSADKVNHDNFGHYVKMDNVTIAKIDDRNYQLTDANGKTCAVYFGSMGVSAPENLDRAYNVKGIVGSYGAENTVYQLLPTELKPVPTGEFGFEHMFVTEDNEVVTFTKDIIVVKQGGNGNKYLYAFNRDRKGYGLIYGDLNKTYKEGDVIPYGFSGKKTTYNAEPELAEPFEGFNDATETVNITDYAEKVTPSQVGHDIWAHYVLLEDVYISDNALTDANGNSCPLYNGTFNIPLPSDLSKPYKVYGIVGSYGRTNTVYQILPTFIDAPQDTIDVNSIQELYNLSKGQVARMKTPLTAIFQSGINLYVQDTNGQQTLAYGSVPGTFVNGDIIKDAIVTWSEYQGAKQMIPLDNFVPAGHGAVVNPADPLPIEEVSQESINYYISFEDVDIIEEDSKFYIEDETGRIQLYDKFGLYPDGFPMGNPPYYVEGFLTIYRGELELYPIRIDGGDPDCGIKGDVNNDKEINVADINALIDIILGANVDACSRWRADVAEDNEIGVADVNALIDLILGGN